MPAFLSPATVTWVQVHVQWDGQVWNCSYLSISELISAVVPAVAARFVGIESYFCGEIASKIKSDFKGVFLDVVIGGKVVVVGLSIPEKRMLCLYVVKCRLSRGRGDN